VSPTGSAAAVSSSSCDSRGSFSTRYERLFLGRIGQEAENRQTDEKPLRWRSGAQAKRCAQRLTLWLRQTLQTVQKRRA
jgi:hypothetical protein